MPDVWGEGAGPVWASGGGESGKAGSHRLCSPQGRGLWSRRQSAQRPQPPDPRAREWLQERPLAEALASPGSSSEVPGPLAASSRSEELGHTESSGGKTRPGVRGAGGPGPRVRAGHKGLQQRGHGVHKEGPPGEGRASGQRGVSPHRAEQRQGRSPWGWRDAPGAASSAAGGSGDGTGIRAEFGLQCPCSSAFGQQPPPTWAPHPVLQVGGQWIRGHRLLPVELLQLQLQLQTKAQFVARGGAGQQLGWKESSGGGVGTIR